jgi:hypothetical protein
MVRNSPVFLLIASAAALSAQHNQVTEEQKAAGWKLLFDGKSFNGWVDPSKKTPPGDAWAIEGDTIRAKPDPRITEDLFTSETFGDFELQFDWKIAPGANSGIKYLIQNTVWLELKTKDAAPRFEIAVGQVMAKPQYRKNLPAGEKAQDYVVGFEYQMIDDTKHKDAQRGGKYQAGALYDMIPASQPAAKAPGEWNQGRIILRGDHIEHWLNGMKVVDGTLNDPRIRESVNKRWEPAPKLKDMLLKRSRRQCPISLQNHGDDAWFRNLKLRQL